MNKISIYIALLLFLSISACVVTMAQNVCKVGDKYGYKLSNGKILIKPIYDMAYEFGENGIAMVKTGEKIGFVNNKGVEIVSPKYTLAGSFSEGLAAVAVGDLWGYIDVTGKEVIPLSFSSAGDFKDGFAIVISNSSSICINKNGEKIVSKRVKNINSFSEGLAIVRSSGGKYGFIDTTGKVVISTKYLNAYDFSNGIAPVQVKGGWIYIGRSGKSLSKQKFEEVERNFSCGRAWVKIGGKFGYIDTSCSMVIAPLYQEAGRFSGNIAAVKLNDKWGMIDLQGKQIAAPEYDKIGDFTGGLAAVSKGGKWGYIDKNGVVVIPVKYDSVGENALGGVVDGDYGELRKVSLNGEWGFADLSGGWYNSQEEYNKVVLNNHFAGVKSDFKIGAYNSQKGTYIFTSPTYGKFTVKVPKKLARSFKTKHSVSIAKSQKNMIDGKPVIVKLAVLSGKNIYYSL